ncbi:phosphatase 2C-like domain-containing protein [Phyllosticta capitalensis]|uniref:phosphatase 2C-like domain-containing protein n=1 Tax=Phyllosticta capitalensis TaxID=121624 RepID=UPI003132046E
MSVGRLLGKRLWRAARAGTARPPPQRQLQSNVNRTLLLMGGGFVVGFAGARYRQSKRDISSASIPTLLTSESAPPVFDSPVEALDLPAADKKLKRQEQSYSFEVSQGQNGRFDVVRLASNSPVEDEYAFGTAPGPGNTPWAFWGVYDGHAGWATSAVLRSYLIPTVSLTLSSLPGSAPASQITSGIVSAFTTLDATIMTTALAAMKSSVPPGDPAVLAALAPAIAGSCALLSMYDARASTLRTACVGDSRAVLGRWNPQTNRYEARPLSVDQTGHNEAEVARLAAARPPGEPTEDYLDSKSGRLLGLAVTRAFGDHRWKWPSAVVREAQERFFGQGPRPKSKSPPYLTAEPVVTETDVVGGERGDFVVMASDGLWDHFGNDEAVECVGRWIEAKRAGKLSKSGSSSVEVVSRDDKSAAASSPSDDAKSKKEFDVIDGYAEWQATPDHFVVEDDNAATHLVKNAFGGSRRNLFCAVMTMCPPLSRNVRDDVTVQVIFFGDV